MDTLNFLTKILPEEGIHYLAIFKDGYKFPFHKVYTDLESMAAAVDKFSAQPELSVYHACATYLRAVIESDAVKKDGTPYVKKEYRVPDNWHRAQAFWMDIDCGQEKFDKGAGYLTKKDAAIAVTKFAKEIGWPSPMLVDSGNGIHAYWPLTKAIKSEAWRKVAKLLKATSMHLGLIADPTRTADFASILRPAGAVNRKNGGEKPVRVLRDCGPSDPKELATALQEVVTRLGVKELKESAPPVAVAGLNDDLVAHLENLPKLDSSAELVAESCQQVAQMRDTKGDVNYEHWRGVIGIIRHCAEDVDLAWQWSAEREATGHSQNDVDIRYETWSAGPTTCDFFELHNPSGCDGCKFKGKIKSPIVLGRVIPIAQEQVVEAVSVDTGEVEAVTIPALPYGYQWDGKHMVRVIVNKDGIPEPHAFNANLFYPTMRIRKEDTTFNIGVRMHLPDNRVRDFEIPFESLASTTDLLRSFAKFELIQSNHKEAGAHMHAYLRDAMEKLKREVEEVNTLTTFGWKYDMTAFLIGDRLYHKDGSVRRVLLGGYAAGKKHVFPPPMGTLEGYASPLNFIYNRPQFLPMQYAICSGWGSILSVFCEDTYMGLMFSLYSGKSGTGKSTVCYNSLYAFGDASKMSKKSEDMGTKNELYASVGTFNNIPLLFDELTKIDPQELSSLAYRISLGEERGRLKNTSMGTRFADAATWRMSPFVTSNKDLHALLSTTQANAEAELVRVVQVNLDQFDIPELTGAALQAFQMACDQIKLNAGAAGDALIRYCVTHVDELYKRMRDKVTMLAEHVSEPKFRFYRNHAACTLVMAEIASELKIIEFDVAALHDFAVNLMQQMRGDLSVNVANTPEDAYNRLVNSLNNRILVTSEFRDKRNGKGMETPRRPVHGEVAGRAIAGDANSKDPYKGRLMLATKEVKDWCAKNRIDINSLLDYLRSHGALVSSHEKVRLTRGTDVPGGQCWCIVIDTLKLEDAFDATSSRSPALVVDNTSGLYKNGDDFEDAKAVGDV